MKTVLLIAIAVGSLLAGCRPDPHWQTNPYGAKTFWEDKDRRSGGSSE